MDTAIASHGYFGFAIGSNPLTREVLQGMKPISRVETPKQSSELDNIIPPEIKEDDFYYLIQELARTEQLSTVLEIGSSAGGGSTEAFVKGLSENPHGAPKLFCMEVSKPRYSELARRYADKPFVHCYNTSSVPLQGFPSTKEVEAFYHKTKTSLNNYPLERVLGWLTQDIDYVRCAGVDEDGIERIKRENNIDCFDMVLIDGSEFTGKSELDKVYGARIILLDDINGFKNYENYQRLVADPDYILMAENWKIRSGFAVFKKKELSLPIHFFTIVLNGEPFIRHHIEVFRQLPFKWHWHIIEGVADLKHDTGWSLQYGGRITDELHRNGLSNDGTTEYLNELVNQFPENITVYRKPDGIFWDGKLEMINAPLADIKQECLLWQVDTDELWTVEQIKTVRDLFLAEPDRTAAYYLNHFFVGENLVTTTIETYGNNTSYEWLRTWRFKPGFNWMAHEPPRLCMPLENGQWRDVAAIKPFKHDATSAKGLVFQHFAYVNKEQLGFKEVYYGYKNAIEQWLRLQQHKDFPVFLRDYFAWVKDGAQVNTVQSQNITPLARKSSNGQWRFSPSRPYSEQQPALTSNNFKNILWVRTDSIGDNILATAMLPYIHEKYKNSKITVLCQEHITELYESCPFVADIVAFDRRLTLQDEQYRLGIVQRLRALNADLVLNSVYSREPLTDFFAINSGAKERFAFNGDLSNISSEMREKHNQFYTRLLPSDVTHKPEIEYHRDFLKGLGIDTPSLQPVIWTTSKEDKFADDFFASNNLQPGKTIALFAGAQYDMRIYRQYGNALSEICNDNGFIVIALGSEREYGINQENLDATGVHTINLCGKTTLRQTAALLKRCRLAVGAETGTAHIACAVGTPNVIILGGGHFGRFMPYSALTSIVCLPLECYGCNWQCKYQTTHCVKDIAPEVLTKAVHQTLKESSKKPRVFIQGSSLWNQETGQPKWKMFDPVLNTSTVEINAIEKNPPIVNENRQDKRIFKVKDKKYLVSAIVSTYNSERFIRGCLEDLEAQTIVDKLEIMVVNSGSEQNEEAIIKEFQKKYNNIKYEKVDERETVYATWNRGIKLSSGKYITNANTDDRHRNDAYEKMVEILDFHPGVSLVYANVLRTYGENETFYQNTAFGKFEWYDFNRDVLLKGLCFVGPQPMWRKSVHDEYGYFDDSHITSGDYEFWTRISQTRKFFHLKEMLGLYLDSPTSIEKRSQEIHVKEDKEIIRKYNIARNNNEVIGQSVEFLKLIKRYEESFIENDANLIKKHHNRIMRINNTLADDLLFARIVETFKIGKKKDALKFVECIKSLNIVPVEKNLRLAAICIAHEEYTKAIELFEGYLKLYPKDLKVLTDLATCYAKLKQYESAIIGYRAVLNIDPDNEQAMKNLSVVQKLVKDTAE